MLYLRRYKTVPNCDLVRPVQRSPIPNFYLAGAPLACPCLLSTLATYLDLDIQNSVYAWYGSLNSGFG